jgi:hypothetical protein
MQFGKGRFCIFTERHIGFGIRWDAWVYELDISVALPFITINVGLGKKRGY